MFRIVFDSWKHGLNKLRTAGLQSSKGLHRASGETAQLFSRSFQPTSAMGRWKGKTIASSSSSVKVMVERVSIYFDYVSCMGRGRYISKSASDPEN